MVRIILFSALDGQNNYISIDVSIDTVFKISQIIQPRLLKIKVLT